MSDNNIFNFEAGRNAHLCNVNFSAKIQLLSKACALCFLCLFLL